MRTLKLGRLKPWQQKLAKKLTSFTYNFKIYIMNRDTFKEKLQLVNLMSRYSCEKNLIRWLNPSHKFQQLPLIPVEKFLAEYPEHANDDEASLTIARIDHEHAERLKLEEQRQGLLKKKQGLIADNKKRKDDLANLDKDLEKFIDVRLKILLKWIHIWKYLLGCKTDTKNLGVVMMN